MKLRAACAPAVALAFGVLLVLVIAGGGVQRSVALAVPGASAVAGSGPGSTVVRSGLAMSGPGSAAAGSTRMAMSPAPPPAGVGPLRPAPGAAGAPLREPAGYRSRDGVLKVTLVASSRVVRIAGRRVVAKVYNGSWVAPTLSIAPGDLVEIKLVNHLHEPTNLHFHGLEISPGGHADNIFETVDPGRSSSIDSGSRVTPRPGPSGTTRT